jgi:hypothetical protein
MANGDYQVGCKTLTRRHFATVKTIMITGGFKKVAFDGTEVNLETINKIINL